MNSFFSYFISLLLLGGFCSCNTSEALEHDSLHKVEKDSVNYNSGGASVNVAAERYKLQLYKAELKKLRFRSKSMRDILLLLLVASLSLSYIIYTRYKQKIKRMNQDIATANDLIDSLTTSHSIIMQQSAVMEQFNNLIEKIPECEKNPRKFINEFISLIRTSKLSNTHTFIYDTVNSQYGGAVDRLKVRCNLSESEAETLCMISMGFSNSAMTIAFDHTTSKTIYNYKSSLKNKLGMAITQSSVEHLLKLS